MSNVKKIIRIVTLFVFLICMVMGIALFTPYYNAKNIAIKSLQIVTIHDEESFQQVKNEIYDIVTPEVQRSLFDKEFSADKNYPIITYKVNKIRGNIIGVNHYEFIVNWTSNGYLTIDSIISVKDGIVYDSKRIDL